MSEVDVHDCILYRIHYIPEDLGVYESTLIRRAEYQWHW